MNPQTILLILKAMDLVVAGVQLVGESKARYNRLSGLIRTLVEEERDPTEEEFAALMAESDAATARIEARAARRAPPMTFED